MQITEPMLVLILADYPYRCSVRWRVAMEATRMCARMGRSRYVGGTQCWAVP